MIQLVPEQLGRTDHSPNNTTVKYAKVVTGKMRLLHIDLT